MKQKGNGYAFIDSQNLNLNIRNQGWILDFVHFRVYLKEKDRLGAILIPNRDKFSALLKFRIFRPYLRFLNDLRGKLSYKKQEKAPEGRNLKG